MVKEKVLLADVMSPYSSVVLNYFSSGKWVPLKKSELWSLAPWKYQNAILGIPKKPRVCFFLKSDFIHLQNHHVSKYVHPDNL